MSTPCARCGADLLVAAYTKLDTGGSASWLCDACYCDLPTPERVSWAPVADHYARSRSKFARPAAKAAMKPKLDQRWRTREGVIPDQKLGTVVEVTSKHVALRVSWGIAFAPIETFLQNWEPVDEDEEVTDPIG